LPFKKGGVEMGKALEVKVEDYYILVGSFRFHHEILKQNVEGDRSKCPLCGKNEKGDKDLVCRACFVKADDVEELRQAIFAALDFCKTDIKSGGKATSNPIPPGTPSRSRKSSRLPEANASKSKDLGIPLELFERMIMVVIGMLVKETNKGLDYFGRKLRELFDPEEKMDSGVFTKAVAEAVSRRKAKEDQIKALKEGWVTVTAEADKLLASRTLKNAESLARTVINGAKAPLILLESLATYIKQGQDRYRQQVLDELADKAQLFQQAGKSFLEMKPELPQIEVPVQPTTAETQLATQPEQLSAEDSASA